MKNLLTMLLVMSGMSAMSQAQLPFREIPEYPEDYTAESVAARMIEGLGFRYYWATEGLRPQDLDYKPSEEARTSVQTIEHIHGLSKVIVNAARQQPNPPRPGVPPSTPSFEEMRSLTLANLQEAATLLRSGDVDLEDCKIIFVRDSGTSEFPFWNNINGPIADALWHCGQVVSFRRASGNPFNSKVSVFSGTVRD